MRAALQLGQVLLAGGCIFIHCERRISRRALDCLLF